jgi:F-type H+-transporting ATPase subunit alpha
MEAFAAFGSDLDASTKQLITRGQRLTQLLKQPQYSPLKMEEQVCVIYAGIKGYLDKIDALKVSEFEAELLATLRNKEKAILEEIRKSTKLDEKSEAALVKVIESVQKRFA